MNSGLTNRGHGGASDEWETPPWLFKALDAEFGFTHDGAANERNHLLPNWYGVQHEPASWFGDRVFCNPPYSDIGRFVTRAFGAELAVLLLPAFVDKDWYRKLFESPRVEWRPFRQRIRFYENGKPGGSPFFGSVLAIVRPR